MNAFDDLSGDPSVDPAVLGLGGAALHRVLRRAHRLDEREGRLVKGRDRTELARESAQALRRGDTHALAN